MQKKPIKWATTLPIKKGKGKKKSATKKFEIDSQKKSKFWPMRMPEK